MHPLIRAKYIPCRFARRRIFAFLALAAVAMSAVAAAPNIASSYINWHDYAMQMQRGYFEQRDRADAAESLAQAQEKEVARLSAQVDELSLSVEPLEAEVERLREYERYASLERDVEGLRKQRSRLITELAPMQAAYDEARSDLMDAWADNKKLAQILEKYGTSGVWLNRIMCCNSMAPAITADDLVLMFNAPTAPLNVGDIPYAHFPSSHPLNGPDTPPPAGSCEWRQYSAGLVAHRIIARQLIDGVWHYRTQGDNVDWPDLCWVPHDKVPFITPSDAVIKGVFE